MRHLSRRSTLVEDCLLAFFVLTITAVSLVVLGRVFSWQARLAFLAVPTAILCCYLRYRAAILTAAISLVAGAWIIVPPRWSFRIDATAAPAILVLACVTTLLITLTLRASRRRSNQLRPAITPVPELHRV